MQDAIMQPASWLEVNLGNLDHNVRTLRRVLAPGTRFCAVVKADAYGLGAVPITRRLETAGADFFAVYSPAQADAILSAGIAKPLLILMPVNDLPTGGAIAEAADAGSLHLAVHSESHAGELERIATSLHARLPVHVEVDTGMSRGGVQTDKALKLVARVRASKHLTLAGVFTHASNADEDDPAVTDQQLSTFATFAERARQDDPELLVHFANTWATIAAPRFHQSMVRVGLGLWGYPSAGTWQSADRAGVDLKPLARWVSRLAHVKWIGPDTFVGYNQTFRTNRRTRIGIVPVGYSDGYPLLLSNKGVVRVGDPLSPAPVLGRVNMDQLIVDLTDAGESVGVGADVEIIASDPTAPNAMQKLAALAQSHPYEMLCRISSRVPRVYVG